MTRSIGRCCRGFGFLVLLVASTVPAAADTTFFGLGSLPGGYSYSRALAVSADGSTVVGISHSSSGYEAFIWTSSGGMVGLGDLPGGSFSSAAYGVSADGSVVVGTSSGTLAFPEPFMWTSSGGMVPLGVLPGGDVPSRVSGISDDGTTVVGRSKNAAGQDEAFRWTAETGMVGLGIPPGTYSSEATAVSADGSVVVGHCPGPNGEEAFRWTSASGIVSIGTLAPELSYPFSRAFGISADGSVIVGYSAAAMEIIDGSLALYIEQYRWTSAGGFQSLSPYTSTYTTITTPGTAYDAVADGARIVGTAAYIWDAWNGARSLETVLPEHGVDLTEWLVDEATAISNDGRVIVGWGRNFNPSNHNEAWMVVFDEPRAAPSIGPIALALLGSLLAVGGLWRIRAV